VYLSYLQGFVTMIQSDSTLLISTYQKSLLEEEWAFVKQERRLHQALNFSASLSSTFVCPACNEHVAFFLSS
jgi:hypothetical protein